MHTISAAIQIVMLLYIMEIKLWATFQGHYYYYYCHDFITMISMKISITYIHSKAFLMKVE